ncbi:MAG: hypothetical protein JSW34_10750 [Candidatus Zixiibacteriota bacterium]|nr:MAG: hypothetical protein JSW34_10750 [candidate division Zixibacteria bacterium]
MERRDILKGVVCCLIIVALVYGCSGKEGPSSPKQAVISMFGAMEKDDKAALAHLLDLPELMKTINEDYALQLDSPRVFTSPIQLLEDLTGNGLTKTRWFAMQRIIGNTVVTGETATVEVTFIDKDKSIGYLTKFGVHMANEKWKIYSFKTLQEPPGD